MKDDSYARQYLRRSQEVVEKYLSAGMPGLPELVETTVTTLRGGHKILIFGNGGSAADAQHLACEFVNRYLLKSRKALPAVALTTDTSIITCAGNDFGFDQIFSRQIEALAVKGDLAVGLSTSGGSPNVLAALAEARKRGCFTAGFTGGHGAALADLCDHLLAAPDDLTPVIQQFHITLGHLWVDLVERRLAEKQ